MSFRVDLESFRGPLDLLLFLVRRHEIDITDIPISLVAEQFLEYLAVLERIDVNAVGDFLEMASTLIEIKSRMVLPRADEESEPIEDPRAELVARLLEYKRYKDASSLLEEQGRCWQQRFTRIAPDAPPRQIDPADQPIREVEMWDLVSAFGRIARESTVSRGTNIIYDDTPIQVYMQQIHQRIVLHGRTSFSEMFSPGMHKSAMIGVFLAILELVRHHNVFAEQTEPHGEIWIVAGDAFDSSTELAQADSYEAPSTTETDADAQADA
ncbi:MAG: segregation/condensation protein A [Pirellulaceae bacterium]